jgi:hypothetical protein
MSADSDEAGHAFQSEAGRCSDAKPAGVSILMSATVATALRVGGMIVSVGWSVKAEGLARGSEDPGAGVCSNGPGRGGHTPLYGAMPHLGGGLASGPAGVVLLSARPAILPWAA